MVGAALIVGVTVGLDVFAPFSFLPALGPRGLGVGAGVGACFCICQRKEHAQSDK